MIKGDRNYENSVTESMCRSALGRELQDDVIETYGNKGILTCGWKDGWNDGSMNLFVEPSNITLKYNTYDAASAKTRFLSVRSPFRL